MLSTCQPLDIPSKEKGVSIGMQKCLESLAMYTLPTVQAEIAKPKCVFKGCLQKMSLPFFYIAKLTPSNTRQKTEANSKTISSLSGH